MMTIEQKRNGNELTVAITGRLDTTTAPQLEEAMKSALVGVGALTLDLTAMEYISSAGLRVLLAAQKIMNKQGKMSVTGVSEAVMEVFEVTGFSDILTIV